MTVLFFLAFFFFNDTATTEIYTLSLHDALPLFSARRMAARSPEQAPHGQPPRNSFVSLLFFGFHWLEFFLGSHFRVRAITSRGGLVLIDRFYYDFFFDQRRY